MSHYEDPNSNYKSTGVINFDKYDEIPVKTTGKDCPPPVESWREANLSDTVLANIERAGYTKPTPVQRYALSTIINERDLMGCAQTGSGKTAAFLLPIISLMLKNRLYDIRDRERRSALPVALILAPTRELACQILDEAKKFCVGTPIRTAILYGGVPMGEQIRDLFRGCDILVATPGRLTDVISRQKVSLYHIRYLCLDEADRMLDMGFEPQIRKIVDEFDMPKKEQRQTLMFSATFPKEIRALAASFLRDYVFLTVGRVGSTTELVEQRFVQTFSEAEREQQLLDILRKSPGTLTLIFVETKKKANYLDYLLRRQGLSATSIHGDRNQMERTAALRSFSSGMTPILIATNVAARGLDISGISHVINFEMTANIDDYVHRIGRTGRAGKTGVSTTFLSEDNSNVVPDLIKILTEANLEVPTWMRALDRRGMGRGPSRGYGGRGGYGGGGFQSRGGYGGGGSGGYGGIRQTTYPMSSYSGNGYQSSAPSAGSTGYSSYGQQSYSSYPAPSYSAPSYSSYPPAPSTSSYSAPPPPPATLPQPPPSTAPSNGHGDRDSYDRKRRVDDHDDRDHRDKYLRTESHRVSSDRDRDRQSSTSSSSSHPRERDARDSHRDYDRERDSYRDRDHRSRSGDRDVRDSHRDRDRDYHR